MMTEERKKEIANQLLMISAVENPFETILVEESLRGGDRAVEPEPEALSDGGGRFSVRVFGHGLSSWHFMLSLETETLDFEVNYALSGIFAAEDIKTRDIENVQIVCKLVYAAIRQDELPDGATRLQVRYDNDFGGLRWMLLNAEGEFIREGRDWESVSDCFVGTTTLSPDAFGAEGFIRV